MIHGIPVTLYERTQTGTDALNYPVYEETPVVVENVLVAPMSAQEVLDTLNLTGKRAMYQLGIPKGDAHNWEDCRVDFFGQKFRVIGPVTEGIEELIPLSWNRKVQVEKYVT
jgi:hypothetical protein